MRRSPHYMVVEHSLWLSTWYENCAYIRIPIEEFDLRTVSFTYGDSHPVFSPRPNKMDGKEYRKKLYTYDEILMLIEKYGLPQHWNNEGIYGPERYIEAHIWSDETTINTGINDFYTAGRCGMEVISVKGVLSIRMQQSTTFKANGESKQCKSL